MEIKNEFRANKVRAPERANKVRAPESLRQRARSACAHWAHMTYYSLCLRTQGLQEGEKLTHARVVAERGLSDLRAYLPAAGAEGDISVSLKGATSGADIWTG